MSTTSSIHSLRVKDTTSMSNSSISSQRSRVIDRITTRLQEVKKRWGPLMAAKEHWEDEYNFPPGRYAGQGL
ncbi:hypothetical protein BJX96DRAFT_68205 [Aspergillus floccosus]